LRGESAMNEFVSPDDASLASSTVNAVMAGRFESAVDGILSSSGSKSFDHAFSAAVANRWPEAEPDALAWWTTIAHSENSTVGLFNLGGGLCAVGELELGAAALELAAAEGDIDALFMLGECELWMGRTEHGREHLRQVVALGGDHMRSAAGVLGFSLFDTDGRTDEEVIDLMTLAGAEELEFPVNLATLFEQVGRRPEALAILEREMSNGNDRAPIVLGNILSEDPNGHAEAEAAYRVGIELGDAYSAFNLSMLLDDQGRNEDSRRWLQYAADHGDEKAQSRLAESAIRFDESSENDVR